MTLAIFDLDNTLIGGDSDYSWGEFMVAQKRVDRDHYQAKNRQFYADYEAGKLDVVAYLEFALEPLSQMTGEELSALHNQFMEEVIQPILLPAANHLLQRHRNRGDRLLVITSTNRFIVEPICHALNIHELLASEPEVIDGRYTGKVSGTPTYQQGKVTRLHQWLDEQNESLTDAYFYSDSINDLPLLLEVDNPVAVDPDDALRREAETRNWPIISLRSE